MKPLEPTEYASIMEQLADTNRALQSLVDLVGVAKESIKPDSFCLLLDMVVKKQTQLIDRLGLM